VAELGRVLTIDVIAVTHKQTFQDA